MSKKTPSPNQEKETSPLPEIWPNIWPEVLTDSPPSGGETHYPGEAPVVADKGEKSVGSKDNLATRPVAPLTNEDEVPHQEETSLVPAEDSPARKKDRGLSKEKTALTPLERIKGHRQRLKDDFLKGGLYGWTEYHILELILCYCIPQKDVKPLAQDLVYHFGSLAGVLDAPYEALCEIPGVGNNTASLLKLFPAVGGAYVGDLARTITRVETSQDAFLHFAQYFYHLKQETVYLLCLNGKKEFQGVRLIAEGSVLAADINFRRIVEEALILQTVFLYLAHNHVASDLTPSEADWEVTDFLLSSLANLGLYLEDHLVISQNKMASMRELTQVERRGLQW